MMPYWVYYNQRKRLAKLGYLDSMKDLDLYTADILVKIDLILAEEEHARSERMQNR